MEKKTDKHGITVLPYVSRIDQYGEVAVKRFNPRVGWNRSEHILLIANYKILGKRILDAMYQYIDAGNHDTFLLSKLCHKGAVAFTEAGNAEHAYEKKYGNYGRGTEK
jgi:hypothetical protein